MDLLRHIYHFISPQYYSIIDIAIQKRIQIDLKLHFENFARFSRRLKSNIKKAHVKVYTIRCSARIQITIIFAKVLQSSYYLQKLHLQHYYRTFLFMSWGLKMCVDVTEISHQDNFLSFCFSFHSVNTTSLRFRILLTHSDKYNQLARKTSGHIY